MQFISITSEALQATVRRLLPSQQGFGEDLQASNVITPIIDLTPTAEGSLLPKDLQQSLAFGSVTSFNVTNTTSTLVNTAGFYRVFGGVSVQTDGAADAEALFTLTDGLGSKVVYRMKNEQTGNTAIAAANVDFIVFLRATDSLTCTSNSANVHVSGCTRQVADVNGELVNPVGFVSQ